MNISQSTGNDGFGEFDDPHFAERASEQFGKFRADILSEPPDSNGRVLEIGSKSGHFLIECRNAGLHAVGTEVSPSHIAKIKSAFPDVHVRQNDIDSLPFESESFEYVVSFQVLEHMSNLCSMLRECERVLKPGGYMYHICPNYNSFYEGHFKILWLPFLRTKSGKLYLRALNRKKTSFGKGIYPVRPARVKAILDRLPDIDLQSLGQREFLNRFTPSQIAKVHQPILHRILSTVYRLRILTTPVLRLIAMTGTYYPITVIARKRETSEY